MKRGQTFRVSLLTRAMLAGVALAISCSPVFAQTTSTSSAGGGTAAPSTGTTTTTTSSGLFGSGGSGSTGVTSASGGGTSPINKNNPFNAYYANPLAAGYGPNVTLKPSNAVNVAGSDTMANTKVTGKGLFGVAMISAATAATTGKTTMAGGTAANANTAANGFATSMGYKRSTGYVTSLDRDFGVKPMVPMAVMADLQNSLQSSSGLATAKNLNVTVSDGQIVVINGVVGSDRERELAERLVRMTPGVFFVRNEITVAK